MTMLEYIVKKRSISNSLSENLHLVLDEDLIAYILNVLDSSYGAFITAFMMKSEALTVDDLVGLLLQEEAKINQERLPLASVTQTNAIAIALTVSSSNPRHQYGSTGNTSNSSSSCSSDPHKQ